MSEHLSPRYREVLSLLIQDKTSKEIAFEMGITDGTVKSYFHRIIRQLGLKTRVGLALWASKHLHEP